MKEKVMEPDTAVKRSTNIRTLEGKTATFVSAIMIIMSLVHLYQIGFGVFEATLERSLHLAFAIPLVFLACSWARKKSLKNIPWYDWILAAAATAAFVWIMTNHTRLMWRMPYLDEPTNLDILFGSMAVIFVLESTRRTVGLALTLVTLTFILYSFLGAYLPGILGHEGVSLPLFIDHIYLTTEGLLSKIIGVISIYTFIFICFGAFMEISGVGNFYIDFSNAIMGKYSGGVAKTSVFSSAMMGSISGSSVANTATTGAFTIPLMQRTGFDAEEAGAVEVAASTGGQILPPIMGAGAFIMAEFTATPYITIVAVSIMPALIYYISVFTAVHIMARKKGLKGLTPEERPSFLPTLKRGFHLLLPLIVLVYLLVKGFTPYYAGFLCIIFLLIVTAFRSSTRFTIPMVLRSLELSSERIIRISPAAACAGIILGVSTQTGVALKISSIILSASGGYLLPAIILVGVIAYLLGMGLPATSAYIIAAILASPALVKLGVPMLAAHLIVFWFSQTSGFTPPVCLCAYTAAAISGGEPMKTGFQSTKLALGILVIPFLFAFSPMIFSVHETTILRMAVLFITATAGMISISIAMEGFIHNYPVLPWERVGLGVAAVMLYLPEQMSNVIGGLMLAAFVLIRIKKYGKPGGGNKNVQSAH